jgi:hypothetical protein
MKGAILHNKQTNNVKYSGIEFLYRFFLQPVKSGLYGFAAFFTVLIFTKIFWYVLGFRDIFSVSTDDVALSLLGFVIVFLFRIVQNFKPADWQN